MIKSSLAAIAMLTLAPGAPAQSTGGEGAAATAAEVAADDAGESAAAAYERGLAAYDEGVASRMPDHAAYNRAFAIWSAA